MRTTVSAQSSWRWKVSLDANNLARLQLIDAPPATDEYAVTILLTKTELCDLVDELEEMIVRL
jgi:hypothetical protein